MGVERELESEMMEGAGRGEKLEYYVYEIKETLEWLIKEANIDRAFSGELGAVEHRRLAVVKTEKLLNAIKKACGEAEAKGLPSDVLKKLSDEALSDVTEYYNILSSSELSAAKALHVSRGELSRVADSVGRLVEFLSSSGRGRSGDEQIERKEGDPLPIVKILELKEKVKNLENENRRLREELERVKGGRNFFVESIEEGQTSLLRELEELRKENEELKRQVEKLRCGTESSAYQSLLEENNALKQRVERLLEALKATRKRYEERLQELVRERDEWRSKAIERTVKTIEDTMLELRNQVESLKRENRELKERLGITQPRVDERDRDYEFYFS
ncbi:MAG: hypothetical protein QW461_07085 [Candidatus Jordarchaeales archaeon]